jgi:CRP-like cAMP-binding protein
MHCDIIVTVQSHAMAIYIISWYNYAYLAIIPVGGGLMYSENMYPVIEKSLRSFLELDQSDIKTVTEEQTAFLERLEKLEYNPGEKIISEGDSGEALYIIAAGKVSIVKESETNKKISELNEGDFFGELSLFTGKPRAASVIAENKVTVYKLPKSGFDYLIKKYPHLNGTLLRKLYERLTDSFHDLEIRNKELSEANKSRMELGAIFVSIVLVVSIYTFVLGILNSALFVHSPPYVVFLLNRILEIVTLYIIIRIVIKSSLPLSSYGVTLKDWKPAVKESLIITAIAVVLLFLFKYAAVVNKWSFIEHDQIIDFKYFDWTYITYIIVAPMQEFLTRGVLQSSIQRLLISRYAWLWAIIITSFLFGALHLHSSINLGIAAVATGLLWGWMYSRHQTLIGVTICHFIVGNLAGLLGLWAIL